MHRTEGRFEPLPKTKECPQMRVLFPVLLCFFLLASCDSSTGSTTPVAWKPSSIPAPPNVPFLQTTVLTGTKTAPAKNPTIEIRWAYSLPITIVSYWNVDSIPRELKQSFDSTSRNVVGYGIDTIKVSCISDTASFSSDNSDSLNTVHIGANVIDRIHKPQIDGNAYSKVIVYCK